MDSNKCIECFYPAIVFCECDKNAYCDLHLFKHLDDQNTHQVKSLIDNPHGLSDIENDERALQEAGLAISGSKFPVSDILLHKNKIFTAEKDGVYMRDKGEITTGKQFLTSFIVWCIDLDERHDLIAAGLDTNEIIVFHYLHLGGDSTSIITKNGPICSIKFLNEYKDKEYPYQTLIISGTKTGHIQIYDYLDSKQIINYQRQHKEAVISIASEPNSMYFASGSLSGEIVIQACDFPDFTQFKRLEAFKSSIISLAFLIDQDLLIACYDGSIIKCNIHSQSCKVQYQHSSGNLLSMKIKNDKSLVYFTDSNGGFFCIDTSRGNSEVFSHFESGLIRSFAYDQQDDKIFYMVVSDQNLMKFDYSNSTSTKISPLNLIYSRFIGKANQNLICGYRDEEFIIFDSSKGTIEYHYDSLAYLEPELKSRYNLIL